MNITNQWKTSIIEKEKKSQKCKGLSAIMIKQLKKLEEKLSQTNKSIQEINKSKYPQKTSKYLETE